MYIPNTNLLYTIKNYNSIKLLPSKQNYIKEFLKNFKQGYKQQTLDKYSVSQSFFYHINKNLKEHHSPIPLLEQKFMFPESFEVRPMNRSNPSKSVKIYNLDIKTPLI